MECDWSSDVCSSDLVGRSADETLRVLDALQTGELCECNRQVGADTLESKKLKKAT
jgi:alkyl hydroperoxide reductase subunit AhpC